MPTVKPPTAEIGAIRQAPLGYLNGTGAAIPGWSAYHDETEHNPRLRWTGGLNGWTRTATDMLNDAQVEALRAAVTLPLRRRRWMIDPNGSSARLTKQVATDLGLPVKGAKADVPRLIGGFSWHTHLFHVLLAPFFGHYFFEQVGEIGSDGLWHLRKLAPRPPRTIFEIDVATDGGLLGVRQNIVRSLDSIAPLIPVDRLAAYVWEQEAGNWVGRSMLRGIYREWLAKDQLMRVEVAKQQRNGMGIPTAKQTDPAATPTQLNEATRVASQWRAGQQSAAGLPFGTDIELKGVTGSLPDTLATIRYLDEQMAKRFLAMFMSLGQGNSRGARSLGDTFVTFFALAEDAMADWVCDVTTLHVIADIAAWNYGVDPRTDPVPLLVSERIEDPADDVADLVNLVANGVLTADPDLEAWVREQRGYPAKPDATVVTAKKALKAASAPDLGETTAPSLSRDPSPEEQHVDWAAITAAYLAARSRMVADWQQVRQAQIDDLVRQIRNARTLDDLTNVSAPVSGADVIRPQLRDLASFGAGQGVQEAAKQGHTVTPPALDGVLAGLDQRAAVVADTLASAITEAATREATRNAGGALPMDKVADLVEEHLSTLTDSFLEEQFGGTLHGALNAGRFAAFDGFPEGTAFMASELMDVNTCGPCSVLDGTQFQDLDSGRRAYPVAGYTECEGRLRCRGTLVAVAPSEAPASVA